MKKSKGTSKHDFLKKLLDDKLTVNQKSNLHCELAISKKMLTMLLRNPKRFTAIHVKKLAELVGISTDEFITLINK